MDVDVKAIGEALARDLTPGEHLEGEPGKRHQLLHDEGSGARLLLKVDPTAAYDASLARLLDAGLDAETQGIVWCASDFLPKFLRFADNWNRAVPDLPLYLVSHRRSDGACVVQGGPREQLAASRPRPLRPSVQLQVTFFEILIDRVAAVLGGTIQLRNRTTRPWLLIPRSGGVGLYVDAFQMRRPMYVGIYSVPEEGDLVFSQLQDGRAQIESACGPVLWMDPGPGGSGKCAVVPVPFCIQDEQGRADAIAWIADHLLRFADFVPHAA